MIKVLHLNTWYGKGGAANSTRELNKLLNQNGNISSKVVVGFNNSDESLLKLNRNYERYLNAAITKYTGYDSIWYPFSKTKSLEKLIDKYDVIHLHNLHGYYFRLKYLKLLKDKPVVWTIRDFWPITGGCAFFSDCNKWVTGCGKCPYLDAYPATKIDRTAFHFKQKQRYINQLKNVEFVTISDWAKSVVRKSMIGHKNITTIYNGLDVDAYKIHYVKDQGPKTKLLFIASKLSSPRKGLLVFLKSLQEIKNKSHYELFFIGEKMPKDLKDTYLNNFDFKELGYVSNTDKLSKIYSECNLFVNLSTAETFGRTNIEAMLSGTHVLTYDIPIMKEILQDKGIYIQEKDSKEIARAIESFHIDLHEKKLKYTSQALREHALTFSQQKMVKAYESIYSKLLNNSGGK